MITVNDIAVEFGGTTLFSEVTFAINETDKIALMGKNGAGKSTLLKLLSRVTAPTTGEIKYKEKWLHSWKLALVFTAN